LIPFIGQAFSGISPSKVHTLHNDKLGDLSHQCDINETEIHDIPLGNWPIQEATSYPAL